MLPHREQNRYNFNGERNTSTIYKESELCPESSRSNLSLGMNLVVILGNEKISKTKPTKVTKPTKASLLGIN
jgi:hypothetical protein